MESFLGKRGTTLSPHFVPVSPPSYKLSRGSCLCVEHSLSLQCQPRAASRRLGPPRKPTPASSSAITTGRRLAYVYCEDEPGRRAAAHPNDHHDALTSYRVGASLGVVLSISCLRRASARSASRTKSFANLNRIAFASASAVLAVVIASAARSYQ
jgi:hypothetical protein